MLLVHWLALCASLLPEHGRNRRLGARTKQVFDSRAFALGGAHSSRFIPAAAANAGVRPPLPRAPGGRPVAPNVGVPLPPELAAPAQAPATQANGFATQARPQHVAPHAQMLLERGGRRVQELYLPQVLCALAPRPAMKRSVCMTKVTRCEACVSCAHNMASGWVSCAQASQLGASQAGASQAAHLDGFSLPPSQLPYAIPGVSDRGRGGAMRASSGGGGSDAAGALAHASAGYGYAYGGTAGNGPATQLPSFQQARAGGSCLPRSASVIRGMLQAPKSSARRFNCRTLMFRHDTNPEWLVPDSQHAC